MLRKILFFVVYMLSLVAFSQFSLTIDGNDISDGTILTYSELDGDFSFIVSNTSANPINVSMVVESITNNSSGQDLQYCWNNCYSSISEGDIYPPTAENLAVGATTAPVGNHFQNSYAGDDTSNPVIYVFRFREVDGFGAEIGSPIHVTYKYDSTTASVKELNQVKFELQSNIVTTDLELKVQENITGLIVNLNGQVVTKFTAFKGTNYIDVSSLSSQLYYVILENNHQQKTMTKIVVK